MANVVFVYTTVEYNKKQQKMSLTSEQYMPLHLAFAVQISLKSWEEQSP
jgi:hypothetical protein